MVRSFEVMSSALLPARFSVSWAMCKHEGYVVLSYSYVALRYVTRCHQWRYARSLKQRLSAHVILRSSVFGILRSSIRILGSAQRILNVLLYLCR